MLILGRCVGVLDVEEGAVGMVSSGCCSGSDICTESARDLAVAGVVCPVVVTAAGDVESTVEW